MLHIFGLIWPILYNVFNYQKPWINTSFGVLNDKKIKRNAISAFHSATSLIFSMLYFWFPENTFYRDSLYYFSSTYFIWDSYLIIIKKLPEEAFLYHHIVALYMLQHIRNSTVSNMVNWAFLIGELSNLTFYPVYHYMKTFDFKNYQIGTNDNLYNSLKKWRHIQAFWYIFLRYFVFGYFAWKFPERIQNKLLLGNLYLVYFMGIFWGFNTIKGLYHDYYVKKILKSK
jgi:hypothetical protein